MMITHQSSVLLATDPCGDRLYRPPRSDETKAL